MHYYQHKLRGEFGPKCSVEGCNYGTKARGLCVKHLERLIKNGDPAKTITRDHIIPLSRGGTDYIDNIVPACRSCNSGKRDKMPEEYGKAVQYPTRSRTRGLG